MTKDQFIDAVTGEQIALRRFLLALCCGNRDEADDIAQEALVKAYLSFGAYSEQGNFSAWLYRIAYRTFIDYRRNRKICGDLKDASCMACSLSADSAFEYQELYDALDLLPPKERTAVLLYYLKGYSVKEIARIVDCREDAVKKQLSRGREQLKTRLKR